MNRVSFSQGTRNNGHSTFTRPRIVKKAFLIPNTFLFIFIMSLPGCFAPKKKIVPLQEIPVNQPEELVLVKKQEVPLQVLPKEEPVIKIQTARMPKKSFLKKILKPLILPKRIKPSPKEELPVSTPPTPLNVDDTAYELFKRCVNLEEDKTLSWMDFCTQMSDVLHKEPTYKDIAQAFQDISGSKSIAYITYKLWWYTNRMPKNIHALYQKHSKSQLIHIIHQRIALNQK